MKKNLKVLFLVCFFAVGLVVLFCCKTESFSSAYAISEPVNIPHNIEYEFDYSGRKFNFLSGAYNTGLNENEKMVRMQNFEKVVSFCPNKIDAIYYCFPEMTEIVKILQKNIFKEAERGEVFVKKNECSLFVKEGTSGQYLDLIDLADNFENSFLKASGLKRNRTNNIYIKKEKVQVKDKLNLKIKIKGREYNNDKILKKYFCEKSCFYTNFSSSSESRKHNITLALSKFDGITLEAGETLSFNAVTGDRTKQAGYLPAKIISNGTFVEGTGGGVCQVSTTLYNACLLAGLEILQVHSHSLPVSYIEPSFDAMVNSGTSDLVIRNNTNSKIVFTTSSKGDTCKVKIFGEKNKYKITRVSEKTQILKPESTFVDTDYNKYENLSLEKGQEKQISFAKDGFLSNGYLNYYNSKGELEKTEKIRSNKYNPTKAIIVKRED